MAASDPIRTRRRRARPKVAPENAQAPSAEKATPQGKSIFLFADGTGNSSAKLFKTNVWRMYEAIDFGVAGPGRPVQVGYYDNGVGTSNFRPLALLGGVFGIGLKSNVLRLYTFLCRNYQPGDRIYAFGFSRGAFTIRLLVGLVADQGILLPPAGSDKLRETSLARQVRDAYRDFRRSFVPNLPLGRALVATVRGLRDGVLAAVRGVAAQWRRLRGKQARVPPERSYPDVDFVGVWDTVAAYGGPFAEFTRGIDDWVFPLTMPDYRLSPKVKKARHALSLDDERDAFWPLLWDEVYESDLISNGAPITVGRKADGARVTEIRTVTADRLKQVWFAGVHSDVGGGYPDESLSYIPLLWMMDELGTDVEFLRGFVERAQDLANPYGPIHDSRAGLASYYRYQPRKIAAFMDPVTDSTLSLRQPQLNGLVPRQGLLRSVCIHESVLARIISGIDNYAPAALPKDFAIVGATGPRATPALTAKYYDLLKSASGEADRRFERQENAWDLVWVRRIVYFLTIGATALLAAAPWIPTLRSFEHLCNDDRCFARSLVGVGLFFVPETVRNSLDPWASVPLLVMILGALIMALIFWGRRTERRFRDRVRQIWRDYLDDSGKGQPVLDGPTPLRRDRESTLYQRVIFVLKWQLLPAACGIATVIVIFYLAVVAGTQTMLAFAEPRDRFCALASETPNMDKVAGIPFATKDSCTDLGVNVRNGVPYRLTIRTQKPWFDDTIPADPRNGVSDPPLFMAVFSPLKRVTSANWLQVITEVRQAKTDDPVLRFMRPLFGLPIDMRKQQLTLIGDQTYATIFCPRGDGHLFLMVNDAAPLLSKKLYANNQGDALVSVEPAPGRRCFRGRPFNRRPDRQGDGAR